MIGEKEIRAALEEANIDYDVKGFDTNKDFKANGIDSLDVMSLFLAIEEKFSISFSEEEATAIKSPQQLIQSIDQKIS